MRIATLTFVTLSLAAPVAGAQTLDHSDSTAMVSWVNEARAARSLPPLTEDPRLDAVAEGHSVDMAQWGYFSHQSPRTGAVEDRVNAAGIRWRALGENNAAGIRWRALGENIAFNQSARAAHEALLRSPGHYANIVGAYRSVGIGIARTGDGVYVTEVFGSLLDSPETARPATPVARAPVASPPSPPSPRARDRADGAPSDEWNGWTIPPIFQGLNIPGMPGWGAPSPQAPRPREVPGSRRAGVRNCEVDTPFGHLSITIAGDGIDTTALPCNPDGSRRPAQPQSQPASPRVAPTGRPPAGHTVPRIEVPPVPRVIDPSPSNEPLGTPVTI